MGTALTPFFTSSFGLVVTIGVLSADGLRGGELFGADRRVGAALGARQSEQQPSGLITGGGSFGQFLFAPITQKLISTLGLDGRDVVPRRDCAVGFASGAKPLPGPSAMLERSPIAMAACEQHCGQLSATPVICCSHGSFLTCGFHIAFLVTHLPGEVDLCGLPASVASWTLAIIGLANIAGSFTAGWMLNHFRGKYILFGMYGSRTLLILIYLAAPKTEWTFYLLAVGLGFSWLGTAPPTAGVVGKLFGTRYLATLYGMTMLSHQTGAFFGAWLGGLAFAHYGNYLSMWYADALFAAVAALLNLPIREPRIERAAVPA